MEKRISVHTHYCCWNCEEANFEMVTDNTAGGIVPEEYLECPKCGESTPYCEVCGKPVDKYYAAMAGDSHDDKYVWAWGEELSRSEYSSICFGFDYVCSECWDFALQTAQGATANRNNSAFWRIVDGHAEALR